jgi:Uma2 family endonuclease
MAVQPTRRQFTVAEYYRMAAAGILDEDDRVELIEGEIIQMPSIGEAHASCVNRLNESLIIGAHGRAVVTVQNPLRVDDRSEPVPDLLLAHRRADFYAAAHPTPADVLLLIEVSDTTLTYDRGTKVPLYAHNGVSEIWVVDLQGQIIWVYREPTPTGYRVVLPHRRGERLAPLTFADLQLAVDDILG